MWPVPRWLYVSKIYSGCVPVAVLDSCSFGIFCVVFLFVVALAQVIFGVSSQAMIFRRIGRIIKCLSFEFENTCGIISGTLLIVRNVFYQIVPNTNANCTGLHEKIHVKVMSKMLVGFLKLANSFEMSSKKVFMDMGESGGTCWSVNSHFCWKLAPVFF